MKKQEEMAAQHNFNCKNLVEHPTLLCINCLSSDSKYYIKTYFIENELKKI